jgi:sulfur carrier protein
MKIRVNGKDEVLSEKAITLEELVIKKGLVPQTVVIEHNREVTFREKWPLVNVQDNDQIEIVRLVGGG